MKSVSVIFTCLLSIICVPLTAATDPSQRLISTIEASLDVIYAPDYAQASLVEKESLIRAVVENEFNLDILIRRAIGRNWDLMDAGEQVRVLELVKQLVVKAYIKSLVGKDRPKLSFGNTIQVSSKRLEIDSTILTESQSIRVMYRLGLMQSGWEIYDIVAEDISVVSNYRQQLDDHFRQDNAANLIQKLQELLQAEDLNDAAVL